MEVRRSYVSPRPAPAALLPRIRPAVAPPARAADVLALTSKSKAPEAPPTGLSQIDAAKRAFWPKFLGGAAVSMGGLGITAVGVMGVATLPYAAFAGLFVGGLAVMGLGLALAWQGASGVAEARQALDHEGLG